MFHWKAGPKAKVIPLPSKTRFSLPRPTLLAAVPKLLRRAVGDDLIPEWTRRLVEQIFASHLEDWPAVLKSLRTIGDDVRARAHAAMADQKAALQ